MGAPESCTDPDDSASDIGILGNVAIMHQTTVRFGHGLWADLERAAADEGISVAQFVREAAIARLSVLALERRAGAELRTADATAARPAAAIAEAAESVLESEAVWQQSRQARQRAAELRAEAEALRRQHSRYGAPSPSRPPA